MAIGTEFLTSNLNIAYPFRDEAPGLARSLPAVHGGVATLPLDFLADAYFSVAADAGRLYLQEIDALGGTAYLFTFSDAGGSPQAAVVVDTIGWIPGVYYDRIQVIDAGNNVYGKIVIYTPSALAYLNGTTADSFQQRLPLEDTVVVARPAAVDTFELYATLPPIPDPYTPGPITGDVQILSGYNVTSTATAEDTGDVTDVALAATPKGEAPCTHADSQYIKGLMQLLPDENGNVQISSGQDGCYNIMVVSPMVLEIQGTCTACCTCDDYKNVATAIENLLQRSKVALTTLSLAHNGAPNGYTAGVDHFNQHVAGKYMGPKLVLVGTSGAGWSKDALVRGGSLHLATLDLSVRNNSQYKTMTVTGYAWDTSAMAGHTVMLRNWAVNQNATSPKHPFNTYQGPLSGVTYPYTDIVPRGEEVRHHLDVQIAYYDGAPITWTVKVTVTGVLTSTNPILPPLPFTIDATTVFT